MSGRDERARFTVRAVITAPHHLASGAAIPV
jgi:hypothetical protein